jgi:hypothetical protein
MRTKKPRSGKAAKPAGRTVRRVARTKPKAPRRKPSHAKAKGGKPKTPKKSKRVVKRKTKAAVKTKTVRKRVSRKPKAEAVPIPIESTQVEQTPLDSITQQPNRIVKRKTRAAVKTKTVTKRVIRKPKAEASPIPIESALAEPTPLDRIREKPNRVVKRETRPAVKSKAVIKRFVRKPKAEDSPMPLAIEQPVFPVVAASEQES